AQLTELQKQFVVAYEPARKADGTAETDTDGKSPVYNVTYYSKRSKEADDFAKQIFTTLATVFVSVISFYFGSSSAMSAAKTAPRDGGVVQKITPPNIAKLDPNKIAADSPPTPLNITGDGLGSVTKVQFGSVEVKPDKVADKLVNVTVPASILVQPGIVKVSVVAPNGESSTLDLTVS
ncbi:MAG TPA: IPT/TIG domain-containing protein, partial [Candidatus Angelobacter sp.]|nr:IPT/TIG domain-containing protein [Candidatus Angelobacter sp.]